MKVVNTQCHPLFGFVFPGTRKAYTDLPNKAAMPGKSFQKLCSTAYGRIHIPFNGAGHLLFILTGIISFLSNVISILRHKGKVQTRYQLIERAINHHDKKPVQHFFPCLLYLILLFVYSGR